MYTDDADLRRLRRKTCLKKFHLHDSRHPCFFSQVSFPSNVRIHLPATLELGIIYTPPIHRHSNFVYVLVPAVNPPSTTTHQSIRNPAEAGSFELLNSVHICALSI